MNVRRLIGRVLAWAGLRLARYGLALMGAAPARAIHVAGRSYPVAMSVHGKRG